MSDSEAWAKPESITPVDISFIGTVATDVDQYFIGLRLELPDASDKRIDEIHERLLAGQPIHVCLTRREAISVMERLSEAVVNLRRLEDSGIPPGMMFPGE